MALFKQQVWQGCGERGTLAHCWWECRLVQPLWKAVWGYLKQLKMELPYDPAIPLLEIYSKGPKTLIQKNINTPMFIAALFTIPRIWKQSISRWADKTTKGHIPNRILLGHKKEKNFTLCGSMDGSGKHYAKWNKAVREKNTIWFYSYVESKEQTELTSKTETDS